MPIPRPTFDFRQRHSALGLALVEVAVAAAFLLIASVGVFSALTRMQQSAITNRALTNSDNLLRCMVEQALTRGWDDENTPLDILSLTVTSGPTSYNASSDVTDGNWKQWDFYRMSDAVAGLDASVPIYEDVSDANKNVPARIYRKVQRVAGRNRQLWVTFRVEYFIRGRLISQEAWATRAAD